MSPHRPPAPCREPGCGALTNEGHCPRHRRSATRDYDQIRGKTAERGYGGQHRKWRALILSRDSICVLCDEAPSTVADHIVPVRNGGDWSLENGQGVCRTCHQRKTSAEQLAKGGPGRQPGGRQISGAGGLVTGVRPQTHAREMTKGGPSKRGEGQTGLGDSGGRGTVAPSSPSLSPPSPPVGRS